MAGKKQQEQEAEQVKINERQLNLHVKNIGILHIAVKVVDTLADNVDCAIAAKADSYRECAHVGVALVTTVNR